MIHPLIPFTFMGMFWYQGENGSGPGPYAWFHRMRPMVADMRAKWKDDFPVYLLQIASWREPLTEPTTRDLAWAVTRVAQLRCLSLAKTGMAVTVDIGDANDIHSKNKRDVGERLAWWALSRDYGHPEVACSGPLYEGITVEGEFIRVRFTNVGHGLMVGRKVAAAEAVQEPSGQLRQFAIAGADRTWHWAQAVIDGGSVMVSSRDVAKPVAVRYAFAQNPAVCNLYKRDGLPASPFRGDAWDAP
jgi:sialate O-acetylesterase